ncbi:MAG: hypothetical protein V8Q27_05865 [Eubacteriales bacterium]
MSQEKVDRYKEQKANRKQIMAKEKREKFLVKLCAGLVALALVCWLAIPSTIALTNRIHQM